MAPANQEIRVKIRNLAVGGSGVGEVLSQNDGGMALLGITAFVPYTAIGETVSARVVEKKQRYLHADLLSVEESSPKRVDPACRYFSQCGGCELQHMNYPEQLRVKHSMILGSMRSSQISSKIVDLVKPVVPSEPFGYRRRIKLHIDSVGKVGFYRSQSRAIVEISSCEIADPRIREVLSKVRDLGQKVKGKINSLSLETDAAGVIAVLGAPYTMGEVAAAELLRISREYFPNVTLIAGGKDCGGSGRQILELPLNSSGTLKLKVPVGAFSQVNWKINLELIDKVLEYSDIDRGAQVLDLFSGAGNFSLPLAKLGASVTAIECDRRLVELGRENATQNHLNKNLVFVNTSVEQYLRHNQIPADSVLIADPPRSGLGPMVGELKSGKRLILISCHLPSFVRDLKKLTDTGWEVETIEPFDMFAQTSYLEVLGVLRRA